MSWGKPERKPLQGPPRRGPEQMRPTELSSVPIVREANSIVAFEASDAHKTFWSSLNKLDVLKVTPFLPDALEPNEATGRPPVQEKIE